MVGSPPPFLAAMMMARLSLLHSLPRLASMAPFLCLIVAQCECPDMLPPTYSAADAPAGTLPRRLTARALNSMVGSSSTPDQFAILHCMFCRRRMAGGFGFSALRFSGGAG